MSPRRLATHWRIDEVLSRNATTSVYGVTHTRGERAAFKLLRRSDEEAFAREVAATELAALAGSPALLTHGSIDHGRYLVVERVAGETLESVLRRRHGLLDYGTALLVAERLAGVIEGVHALGMAHRDLQPSNVIIAEHGDVKIIDFGHSAFPGNREARAPSSVFAAPEQRGEAADPLDVRGDVYGVAAILYAMLTGDVEPLRQLAMGECREISLLPIVHLPDEVAALVDEALAREPHRRIASAPALRRRIAAVRATDGIVALPEASHGDPQGETC